MSSAIYQAITNAMADISPIAKAKRNKEQGFQYRGVDDVMNELSPILTKHKIFVYPEVVEKQRQERQTKTGGTLLYSILTIKYHFAAEDGSEVCATVIGEGMDSGDKASNKAMAVAYKYACMQMFCIPTEGMDDPDGMTPPPSVPKNRIFTGNNSARKAAEPESKKQVINEIGAVLKTLDPDQMPYFSEKELAEKRELVKSADLSLLKSVRDGLKRELEKRIADFSPVPWTAGLAHETAEGEFADDIPDGMNGQETADAELDIF